MSLPEKLEILGSKQQSVDNRCAQVEDLLSANESLLEDVFESIQDGILVLDTDFIIRRVNSVMNKWYGKHVPLEGNKCHIIYYNRDKPCDFCPALRCFQSGKTAREIIPGSIPAADTWRGVDFLGVFRKYALRSSYGPDEGAGHHLYIPMIFHLSNVLGLIVLSLRI